jgi:hypothetical protein
MEKRRHVALAVFVVDEARSPVVATLDEMVRMASNNDAGRTWHAGIDRAALPGMGNPISASRIAFQGV